MLNPTEGAREKGAIRDPRHGVSWPASNVDSSPSVDLFDDFAWPAVRRHAQGSLPSLTSGASLIRLPS